MPIPLYFQPSLLWWTWKDRRWMFQNIPLKFHLCREVIQPSGNWEMILKIDSWKERRRHGTASHSVFWSADSFFERVHIIEKLDSEDWCRRNSSVWAGTRKRLLVCAERYHALEWFCVNLTLSSTFFWCIIPQLCRIILFKHLVDLSVTGNKRSTKIGARFVLKNWREVD